jgi:CheY-like chemotaxis protein
MDFQFRHHNRMVYPQKHLMVVEDIIHNQKRVLDHFHSIFDSDGIVQLSLVPGSLAAAAMIKTLKIDLIILDHDLPEGNGTDLLNWMKTNNVNIPVITFSGIPYNNQHMGNLGAAHVFQKEEVISGKTDDLIKSILGLTVKVEGPKIAEHYINTIGHNNIILPRYWVTPNILVGGNIIDQNDWEHLKKDFGIVGVINVDGLSDKDKSIDNLLECPVPDNGNAFPKEYILQAIDFITKNNGPVYIHCHLGFSRSPHFTYAVLRGCYLMNKEDALAKVKSSLPSPNHHWGFNQHTASYIRSIEETLSNMDV